MSDAIGGYFELELPDGSGEHYWNVYRYQSASAAFQALLQKERPARVWMPWYICGSMIGALQNSGIPVERYAIDETLNIKDEISLAADEWLVYVNYFGVCDRHVASILARYASNQVVIDCAHAFFSPPRQCLATLYSPRKFFGVPDGGYLVTAVEMPFVEEDERSIERCNHLLKRLGSRPEEGYEDYRNAEAALLGEVPRKMSLLTQRMLASIDYDRVRAQRNTNFFQLHGSLDGMNALCIQIESDAAPMSYPFFCESADLRKKLLSERIFIPTYWPGVCARNAPPEWEQRLTRNCLVLPCDQRYSSGHMTRMLNLIYQHLHVPNFLKEREFSYGNA